MTIVERTQSAALIPLINDMLDDAEAFEAEIRRRVAAKLDELVQAEDEADEQRILFGDPVGTRPTGVIKATP